MGNPLPLDKPSNLNWNAASVELPEVPMLPPGEDAMSMTISAVLPTLTAPLTASVAALQAKETMFSGKLGEAESAYQNADDSGQQSVGQMSSMLGQVGQMAQQAGGAAGGAGGGSGGFGQLIQQAMQAAQGAGSQGGTFDAGAQSSSGSQANGAPQAGAQPTGGSQFAGQGHGTVSPVPQRDSASPETNPEATEAHRHEVGAREAGADADRQERAPVDGALPGQGQPSAGPAPVAPPQHDDADLSRRM